MVGSQRQICREPTIEKNKKEKRFRHPTVEANKIGIREEEVADIGLRVMVATTA